MEGKIDGLFSKSGRKMSQAISECPISKLERCRIYRIWTQYLSYGHILFPEKCLNYHAANIKLQKYAYNTHEKKRLLLV